jgi:hypothetical protein
MPQRRTSQQARQRQTTPFGQLDTTPTSHHFQAPETSTFNHELGASKRANDASQGSVQPIHSQSSIDYTEELDDEALIEFGDSLTMGNSESNLLRSSPVNDLTPSVIWDFESESLFNSSSPKSGTGKLPDTLPIPDSGYLPAGRDEFKTERRVDLSETGSTGRLSSPDDNHTDINWDFLTTPGGTTSHIDDNLSATPRGNVGGVLAEVEPDRSRAATLSGGVRQSNTLDEIADSFEGIQHGPPASACLSSFDISSEEFLSSPPPDPDKTSKVESAPNLAQNHHRILKPGAMETPDAPEESPAVMTELNQGPGQKRRQRAKSPFKCPQTKQEESRRSTKAIDENNATPSKATTAAKRSAPKGKSNARKKVATAANPSKATTTGKTNRKGKSVGSTKGPATSKPAAGDTNSPVSSPKPTGKAVASKKVAGRGGRPQDLFVPSPRAKQNVPQGRKTRQTRAAAPAREALIISSDSSSSDESEAIASPATSRAMAREARSSDSNLSLVDTQPFLAPPGPSGVHLSAQDGPRDLEKHSGADQASNELEVVPESPPSLPPAAVLSPPPPPSPRRLKRKSDEHESQKVVPVIGQKTARSDDRAHDKPASIKRRRLPDSNQGNDVKACAALNLRPDSPKISQKKLVVSSKEVEVTSEVHKSIVNTSGAQAETPTAINGSVTRSKNQASAVKSCGEEPMSLRAKQPLSREGLLISKEEKSHMGAPKVLPSTIPNSQKDESLELCNESIDVNWQWDASELSSNSQPVTPILPLRLVP